MVTTKKRRPVDLVYVEWLDAKGHEPGWKKIEDIQKDQPAVCHSVGWIIEENKKFVRLAADWNDSDDFDREQIILKPNITKRVKLKIGR